MHYLHNFQQCICLSFFYLFCSFLCLNCHLYGNMSPFQPTSDAWLALQKFKLLELQREAPIANGGPHCQSPYCMTWETPAMYKLMCGGDCSGGQDILRGKRFYCKSCYRTMMAESCLRGGACVCGSASCGFPVDLVADMKQRSEDVKKHWQMKAVQNILHQTEIGLSQLLTKKKPEGWICEIIRIVNATARTHVKRRRSRSRSRNRPPRGSRSKDQEQETKHEQADQE